MPSKVEINLAGEGDLDIAVAGRIVTSVGAIVGLRHPAYGKSKLDPKLRKYNQAARHMPWFILRDLDRDAVCPGALVNRLISKAAPQMCLRVPVRAIEAWLMADREAFAALLRIRVQRLPLQPEAENYPKRKVVDLARQSRRREIQKALIAWEGNALTVGPEYSAWMLRFVADRWNPSRAAGAAPSLAKTLERASQLVERLSRSSV